MKKLTKIVLMLALTTPAFSQSSKDRAIHISVGGCATGLALGAYFDSVDDTKHKNSLGTIGINTAAGCLLGLGWAYFFEDDDQEVLVRKNDAQSRRIQDLERVIRRSSGRPSHGAKFSDMLQMEANFSGEDSFERMVDARCRRYRFFLGFDGKDSKDLYLPVSSDVIVKSMEYYIVLPKDPEDTTTVCVKDLKPFGYLDLELRGLGDIFFNHSESVMKRIDKESRE